MKAGERVPEVAMSLPHSTKLHEAIAGIDDSIPHRVRSNPQLISHLLIVEAYDLSHIRVDAPSCGGHSERAQGLC